MSDWREHVERVREYILSSVVRNSIAEEAAALASLDALTTQIALTDPTTERVPGWDDGTWEQDC